MLPFFAVQLSLVSPNKPFWDVAELFLWIIAVSTIDRASYWSVESSKLDVNGCYKELYEKVKWICKFWILFVRDQQMACQMLLMFIGYSFLGITFWYGCWENKWRWGFDDNINMSAAALFVLLASAGWILIDLSLVWWMDMVSQLCHIWFPALLVHKLRGFKWHW